MSSESVICSFSNVHVIESHKSTSKNNLGINGLSNSMIQWRSN